MTKWIEDSEQRDEQVDQRGRRTAEQRIVRSRDFSGTAQLADLPAEQRRESGELLPGGDRVAAEQKLRDAGELEDGVEAARVNRVKISDLSTDARQKLDEQLAELDTRHAGNPDSPKARGDRGEAIACAAIAELGLPTEQGWREVQSVVDGKYDTVHGIDLLAVMDGKPVIVEVKYHQRPILSDYVLREFRERAAQDSFLEMGDGWTRDRWRQLLANADRKVELARSGLKNAYLNPANFTSDESPLWADILASKRVVVLSEPGSDGVNRTLVRQALQRSIAPGNIMTIEV
jgi:hypothetical protein